MRYLVLSAVTLFGTALSGYAQDQEPTIVIEKDAVVSIYYNNVATFKPDLFQFKKELAIVQGIQNGPVPIPTLKEEGKSNMPAVSGLALSDYKPVAIPNKYEKNELIKDPIKITIRPNKFHEH